MPAAVCNTLPKPYATPPPAPPPVRPIIKFLHPSSPDLLNATDQRKSPSIALCTPEDQRMTEFYPGAELSHEAEEETVLPYTYSKLQYEPSFMDLGANTDATQPTPNPPLKVSSAISSPIVPHLTKTDSPFCSAEPQSFKSWEPWPSSHQLLSPWAYQSLTPKNTDDLVRKGLMFPHFKEELENEDNKIVWDSRPWYFTISCGCFSILSIY